MSGESERIRQHMESPSSSEVMCFDPRTGKLMVQNKSEAERRRDTDRAVVEDMNKEGSGGFFWNKKQTDNLTQ